MLNFKIHRTWPVFSFLAFWVVLLKGIIQRVLCEQSDLTDFWIYLQNLCSWTLESVLNILCKSLVHLDLLLMLEPCPSGNIWLLYNTAWMLKLSRILDPSKSIFRLCCAHTSHFTDYVKMLANIIILCIFHLFPFCTF